MIANDLSDVFVSYRRVNVGFAKKLVASLNEAGKEVWVDWEDIPPGSEAFTEDIKRGLEGADAFICVLTPEYLESTYCVDMELGYALELKKKIIPIVLQKFDETRTPANISHINWIYFTPHAGAENTFDESIVRIFDALDQDYHHTREHRRLALRAIDWNHNDRKDSFLLAGDELARAEVWLMEAAGKTPDPTELHKTYIRRSYDYARQQRRQRVVTFGVIAIISTLTIIAAFFGFAANSQRLEAEAQALLAVNNAATAIVAQDTATVAQGEALEQANVAATQAAIAEENAATAIVAQGEAIAQANIAQTQVGIAATAQGEALEQADLALTSEAQAVIQADFASTSEGLAILAQQDAVMQANVAATQAALAEENAATATVAQGQALIQAALAEENAATAIVAQGEALVQANEAATQADLAEKSAMTATVAQGLAQIAATGEAVAQETAAFVQEANANLTQAAIAAIAGTDVDNALATSKANAATAIAAQGEALIQADLAETQAAVAENNAATATIAQGQAIIEANIAATAEQVAEEQRAVAQAQALIVRAEQARLFGDANVAMTLALEAAVLNPDLLQIQSVLNQVAAVSPRLAVANVSDGQLRPQYSHFMTLSTLDPTQLSLWNIRTRQIRYRIQVDAPIEDFVFSADGQYVITAAGEAGVAIWDANDGTLIAGSDDQMVNRVAVHPDGTRFISAGLDGVIFVRDLETSAVLGELRNTTDTPYDQLHFNVDGRWLYAWSLEPPFVRSLWNFEEPNLPRRSVEEYVLVSSDNAFRINRNEGQFVIHNMDGDGVSTILDGDILKVYAFTPDNSQLLVLGQGARFGSEARIALLDRDTGDIDLNYLIEPNIVITGGIQAAQFLDEGQTILAIQNNNDVTISESTNGVFVRRIGISSVPLTLYSIDERYVVAFSETNTALIFDLDGLEASIIVSADEKTAATEKIKSQFLINGGLYGNLFPLDWQLTSPQETYQLSTFDGFNLNLNSNVTGEEVAQIPNRFDNNNSSIRLFSDDERYIVLGWRAGYFRVWDTVLGEVVWEAGNDVAASNLEEIIFLPDNQQFVTFYTEAAVLWDIPSQQIIHEFALADRVSPLSRNETLNNGNVHSWMFIEHHNQVLSDESTLARVLFDENDLSIDLVLWNLDTGELIEERDLREDISADDFVGVRFSLDGLTYVRIGRSDNVVEMFNTITGLRIRRFIGHRSFPVGVGFNLSGDQLVRTLQTGNPLRGIATSLNIVFSPDNTVVGFTRDDIPIPSANLEVLRVETLQDVVAWVRQNRGIRELSCAEREQYSVLPLCDGGVETATPTSTIPAVSEVSPTPTATTIVSPTATPRVRGVIQADSNINVRSGP